MKHDLVEQSAVALITPSSLPSLIAFQEHCLTRGGGQLHSPGSPVGPGGPETNSYKI